MYLDRAEILGATVAQLRKDLSLADDRLGSPPDPTDAFEQLRRQVIPLLEALNASERYALKTAMYRVDIPEAHFRRVMANGGLHALAGEVVLRALQKVLTRLRFAGRY